MAKTTVTRKIYEEKITIYRAEIDADLLPDNFDDMDWSDQQEFWEDNCESESELVKEKWLGDEETYEVE